MFNKKLGFQSPSFFVFLENTFKSKKISHNKYKYKKSKERNEKINMFKVKSKQTKSNIASNTLKKAKIEALPKNVRDSIPFRSAMPNGIIETSSGVFTKSYHLKDVNFQLAPHDEQEAIYSNFMDFLNSFDENTKWQFTIFNHRVPKRETLEQIRIKPQRDGLNKYRDELNQFKAKGLKEGSNSIVRDKYLTVSIEDMNAEHAAAILRRVDANVNDGLKKITNEDTYPMSTMKRLELLYNIYNQDTDYRFGVSEFDKKDSISLKDIEKQGLSIKDYVGPGNIGMDFSQFKHFKIGETYARVFYLHRVGKYVDSTYLSDIAEISSNMLISVNAEKMNSVEASRLAKKRVEEIEYQISQIKLKSKRNNEEAYISPTLERQKANAYEVENDINSRNQNVFFMSMFVCIFTDTKEELEDITKQVKTVSEKNNCPLRIVGFRQQEPAFNSCLPLCRNEMFFDLFFTTESAAVFIPFATPVLNQKDAVYYGNNMLSHSMIFHNRLSNDNYNALIFGASGSGKSFIAKYEMNTVHLSTTNSQCFVVDPSREYIENCLNFKGSVIKLAVGNNVFINPLDLDISAKDSDFDPITTKVDFVLSMLKIMNGNQRLEAPCRSLVDRCIRKLYKPYLAAMRERTDGVTCDPSIAPTLCDLYQELNSIDNIYASQLAGILELYTVGSFSTFAHRTNIVTDARMIVYDIQGLGEEMWELGLFVCLNDIWNRTIENRKKDIYTWSYFDEFHLLLKSPETTAFVLKIWKMFRKWYGVPTGILQNTTDLLRDEDTQNIINNTSFVIMKKSKKLDAANLQVIFGLSDSQVSYLNSSDRKVGLLYNGNVTVPFKLDFPTDTKLFKAMDTEGKNNPKETDKDKIKLTKI